jgi:glycosyltransferase involved in cell wall biosynthesis
MKVLVSAYACEPGKGSEPAVGWNLVAELAAEHEVWVLTRANNRPAIEAATGAGPKPNLHFVYYDLPRWGAFWKPAPGGVQAYYYLWQVGAGRRARALHAAVGFDLVHHLTFGRYWTPSFLAQLPVPFVWGPVGGGETAPGPFVRELSARGRLYERLRLLARRAAEADPSLRVTARRSAVAIATTPETAARLAALGAERVRVLGHSAVAPAALAARDRPAPSSGAIRFVSVGRLLHWKGVHLGLRAFAAAELPAAEYWVVGDGPERRRLEILAAHLGVAERVRFHGAVPQRRWFELLDQCHALVHPSLHDSSPFVCVEALASGLPVLCLDLGGPATQITDETGFRVPARTPTQAVRDLAGAMRSLAADGALYARMSAAARARAAAEFGWTRKGELLREVYREAVGASPAVAMSVAR